MRIFIILICIFLNSGNFYCQLIRPNVIYENVIKEVYDHYNNTGITLLHATQNPIEGQGLRESRNLLNLQVLLSRAYIPTAITSMSTFYKQVEVQIMDDFFYKTHMTRPLLVLLNDDDDLRQQFARGLRGYAPMNLKYHTWLIFFREETSIEWYFQNIYVPFDCIMMVSQPDGNLSSPGEIITEVYQIDEKDKLRSSLLGTWNQEMGIKLSKLSLYQRRNDFQGRTLRVLSLEDPPQSTLTHDHNGALTGLGGFFGELMDILQERMNCTFFYEETNEWEGKRVNGTWQGVTGRILTHGTDIIAAAIIMTEEKSYYMYFTTPIYSTKLRIYIKRPAPLDFNWGAYFTPLGPKVWIAIVVTIAITTITMFLVNSAISLFATHWKNNEDTPTSALDIFFAVFGVFCGQGMAPSILDPIRITHFAIHLTGVIILAAYSAALISALAVREYVLPFTTMEGLLQDGTYRLVAVVGNSAGLFLDQSPDEILRAIDKIREKDHKKTPNNDLDGLHRACSEDKYAFMTRDDAVSLLQSQVGCTLLPLDSLMQVQIAFGLLNHSPYREIINSHLFKLRDSGVIEKLLNSYSTMPRDNVEQGLEPVEMKNILPLLVLLLAGIFMSMMILGIEKFLKRNEKIIKKEKKIVKKFLKNIKPPLTQKNHLYPFYN